MVPELSEMKLLAGRRCQLPVSMTATVNVNDAKVEALLLLKEHDKFNVNTF
jgi:hypothetical protein